MTAQDTAPVVKRGLWYRLYHGETTFDFVGRRKIGYAISGALILLTLISLLTRGLNLGIDFEGGVSWEFPQGSVTAEQVSSVLSDNGITVNDAKIQLLSGTEDRIRVQVGNQADDVREKVRQDLATLAKVDVQQVSKSEVSPTWGSQITRKALWALLAFFVLLTLYISWRFEWKMAIAAIAAVIHDVGISVGIYSLVGFEVTPATVIAFLTILGFSLYDTIVVFDKVQENTQRMSGRTSYGDIVNLSMNQVLMRSLNTSIAAVLPVLSILVVGSKIMGAVALEDFALALLIGLVTGSYSSIFIATPILAWLKEREPKYRALKDKRSDVAVLLGTQQAERAVTRRPTVTVDQASATATQIDPSKVLSHPPRPRKKQRR